MANEYIPLFLDFNDTTQDLSDEECGRLIRAMVTYANGEDYACYLGTGDKVSVAFRFLKGFIDRNAAISKKRAIAGATRNKPEQNGTDENKPEQNEAKPTSNTNTKTNTKNKTDTKGLDKMFDRFWAAYPRRVNKQAARKAFDKLKPDENMMGIILRELDRQKHSQQWTKDGGQFIPHPATWLNGARWEDEVQEIRASATTAQGYSQRDYSGEQEEAMNRMLGKVLPIGKGVTA